MIELSDLAVKFGGVTALNGIIGPNGAGTTTTMNVISGFLLCKGHIRWNGEEIGTLPAHKRTRWGLRRSFQLAQIADDLTIAEKLQILLDATPGSRADKRADLDRALEVAGMSGRAQELCGGLTTFEHRLTDVARCLVGKPKIVMFDEPGGGLSREEAAEAGEPRALCGVSDGSATPQRYMTGPIIVDILTEMAFHLTNAGQETVRMGLPDDRRSGRMALPLTGE